MYQQNKMRNVFDVASVVTVPKDLEVSSVTSSSNSRVYIGMTNGTLMVYALRRRDGDAKYELIQTISRFSPSKSEIQRLEAYARHNLLLSVTDRYVTVHDLNTLKAKTQLPRTKDCEAYAVDSKRACLCAYAKRKIVFYVWDGTDVSSFTEYRRYDMSAEIPPDLRDGCTVSLVWVDRNVCLGIPDRGYVLVDVETGLVRRKIFDVRSPAATIVSRTAEEDGNLEMMSSTKHDDDDDEEEDEEDIPPDDEILLAHENRGYFMDTKEVLPSRVVGRCVKWTASPRQILSVFPYVVALTQKNHLEIHSTLTTKLCQVIVNHDNNPIEHLAHVSSGNIFVFASKCSVYACTMIPISKQVSRIKSEDYEEALSLCYLKTKNGVEAVDIKTRRELHEKYGRAEFKRKRYASARTHFLRALTNVRDVMDMFSSSSSSNFLNIKDEKQALSELLIPYLVQKRRNITDDDKTLLKEIDTTLFRAYLCVNGANSPVLLAFLRSNNMCVVEECEKAIRKCSDTTTRWEALVELYASCGMHRKALNLLLNRLEDEVRKHSGGESRKFVIRMVEYLSCLEENENLIFEFSRPVFNVDCGLALRVFTSTSNHKKKRLDPRRVLAHLKSCSAGLHEDTLVISYLERMIENEGEELDVEFHNELVHQYVEHAERYASSTNEVPIERETSSKRKSLRTRLMNFLSSENARYDAKQMLEEFPPTKLLEERALLLRRVGLHDRALHIYVHKLKSLNLAEKYCDQVYTTKKSDVYVALIRTCLRKPPDEGDDSKNDEKKRVHDAIELMCKYHDRIDPVKVLSLLPVTTPVSELRKYLKFTFSRRDHDRRTVPVERELRKLECLDLEQRLSKLRSRSVTLRSEDKCSNCSRLIDNVSFSVLMDKETGEIGDIVHFRCKCSNHSDDLLDKEEE